MYPELIADLTRVCLSQLKNQIEIKNQKSMYAINAKKLYSVNYNLISYRRAWLISTTWLSTEKI